MADEDQEDVNPLEQLVELLVYAPIGLLYEYEDVVPRLVRRGRSQVQLARVIGQLAVKGRQQDPTAVVGDVAGLAATALAKAVTEFGAQVGLAPKPDAADGEADGDADTAATADRQPPAPNPESSEPADVSDSTDTSDSTDEAVSTSEAEEPAPLPIAGYDDLTARQIVALLPDLNPAQRDRIRAHEVAGRNRKTVLAKLDRLDP